ncbi:MAG: OmpP1/FadL family transporter [Acidobacteriota bacterium]
MKRYALTCVALLASCSLVNASGFGFYEHSAAATALAGAYLGRVDSVTALFYNPASIGKLSYDELSVGATLVSPSFKYTGLSGSPEVDGESNLYLPPNGYYARKLGDQFTFGFGFYVPYGLTTEWNENWVGRYVSIKADLRAYYFNPVLAYNLNDQVSVAGGISYVHSTVGLKRKIDLTPLRPAFGGIPLPDVTMSVDAGGDALGFNAGIIVDASPDITLGASYRSKVTVKYDGDIAFDVPATGYGPAVDDPLKLLFPGGGASTTIVLPQQFNVGFNYHGMERWQADFAFWWTGWSSVDRIALTLENHSTRPTEAIQNNPIERDYTNVWSIRLGTEYVLNEQWRLRGGYLFDKNPVPDPSVDPILPDSDRQSFQLGAGFTFPDDRYSVDFAYMALFFGERTTRSNRDGFNGTYNSFAHLFAVNFSYKFK